MYLADGQLFELQIQPSYPINLSDVDNLATQFGGLGVRHSYERLSEQYNFILEHMDSLDASDKALADEYIYNLSDLALLQGKPVSYTCGYEKSGLFELYCNEYSAQVLDICGKQFRTVDILSLPERELAIGNGISSTIYHLDYRRLLDWLAFDIGHFSYDSDEFSNQMVDTYLGVDGIYFTSSSGKVEQLVPKNFMSELSSLGIDFAGQNMYIRNAKLATNYYGHKIEGKSKKITTFNDLLYMQNNYTMGIILVFIRRLSVKLGVPIKLAGLGAGIIDISIGNVYNSKVLIKELTQGFKVKLFDLRSFSFEPVVEKVDIITKEG